MKKEKIGLATSAAGASTASIGAIGAGCMVCAPLCASAKLVGISWLVTTVFGAGAAAFLSKYHLFFTLIGVLTTFIGIYLFIRARKKSLC